MVLKLTPEEKVRRGICDLQKPQPFFAHLSMHLRPAMMPKESPMQTIGVTAKGNLLFAPEFIEKVQPDEMMGLICHEVMHLALAHPFRTKGRKPMLCNVAQDVSVNMIVKRAGLKLPADNGPAGGIPVDTNRDSSSFELQGAKIHIVDVTEKTWEFIYGDILDQLRQQGKNPEDVEKNLQKRGAAGFDTHIWADGEMSSEELERESHGWQQKLANAAVFAKSVGKLPDGIARQMDDLLAPKVSWKQLLWKYIRQHLNPTDWSYYKPGRKSQALGIFLPTVIREGCRIEVICDTSGSIGRDEMNEFLTEIVAMSRSMPNLEMWVSFVDAAVHTRYHIEPGEYDKILHMEPQGGGGTDLEIGIKHIKKNNPSTPVVIVLTDGYMSFNCKRADFPFDVIWCITENGISDLSVIPYGHVIKMGV